jgi:hypothetical protein
VARLWERCLRIIAEVVEMGVKEGAFRTCDAWEVAHLLWTMGNGLIQTENSATRRQLRRIPLERAFEDALDIILRGITL